MGHGAAWARELLENGGFCCVPARRVRARGGGAKAPGGLSGGVRGLASSTMSSVLRSPMPYNECALLLGLLPRRLQNWGDLEGCKPLAPACVAETADESAI